MNYLVDVALADVVVAEAVLRAKARTVLASHQPASVVDWATAHRRIDGRPFSLDRFAPLRALYADDHPHIVVIKPAQRGVSEWAINYTGFALDRGAAAWATEKNGLNVAYVFPSQAALGDFSKERFSGLRGESPYLQSLFGGSDFDAVTFKQVRDSYLYLRGGWSESALLSFSADVLILDEFDRIDASAIALARRRLNASVVRREVDISTPTLPGKGIHALYLQSDQRVYEQPCPACGDWHAYDFFRDVRADGADYPEWRTWPAERLRRAAIALTCPARGATLSDADRCAEGRWVAQAPEVTGLRGYHIPALCWPFVNLTNLAVAAISLDPSEQQEFYRSDLGLPYEAAGARVTAAMLAQLSHELPGGLLPAGPWRDCTMGVDVGSRFHYRVSALLHDDRRHVLAMGAVGSWADLDNLMERYHVRRCVIDALPELHACEQWAAKFPGRVLRAYYPQASALAGELLRVKDDEGIVQINRTMAMDAVYAALAGASERWPAAIHNAPEVIAHLTAPVRVMTRNKHGQDVAEWVHTSPDHLYHACTYDLAAVQTLPYVGFPAVGGQRPGVAAIGRLQAGRVR